MGMFPATKGPRDHHVAKHTSRFASSVLGCPGLDERADAKSNLHSGPWLFYGPSAFNDAGVFPRGSEPRECVGPGVPVVNVVRGSGQVAAVNEQFVHK